MDAARDDEKHVQSVNEISTPTKMLQMMKKRAMTNQKKLHQVKKMKLNTMNAQKLIKPTKQKKLKHAAKVENEADALALLNWADLA